jgi:hypothetical protein
VGLDAVRHDAVDRHPFASRWQQYSPRRELATVAMGRGNPVETVACRSNRKPDGSCFRAEHGLRRAWAGYEWRRQSATLPRRRRRSSLKAMLCQHPGGRQAKAHWTASRSRRTIHRGRLALRAFVVSIRLNPAASNRDVVPT